MVMKQPERFSIGDKAGVFSTSSPAHEKIGSIGYEYLREKGLDIFEHPSATEETGHTAGSIETRVRALHELFENPDIKALFAFWGGANTNEILPFLDYELIKKHPKIVVGFSDT
ncbi:MAG TPA: hypothetical protein ENI23_04445, partial [bacterium]|nr:hypothetical protein [bacterium]